MTEWHKDTIKRRMEEGLKIDKEATETFIKALDPVGMESDKVSKITYTTDIARTSHMCLSCDEHIDVKHLYVRKENYGSIAHSYCVECACIDIKKDDATDKTTDLCIYVTEEVAMEMMVSISRRADVDR